MSEFYTSYLSTRAYNALQPHQTTHARTKWLLDGRELLIREQTEKIYIFSGRQYEYMILGYVMYKCACVFA